MSKRNRIFLGILAAYLIGVAALLYNQLAEIDPRYRESAEDSLVETSQLLSTIIEQNIRDGIVRPEVLRPVFQSLYAKNFSAKIFSVEKNQIELRVYVTDKAGRQPQPAEQNIVDGNQAAGARQLQAIFIILRCGRFVGIDKGDVVAERFALLKQLG